MNNTVEKDFFGFPKLKWIHLTGDVDKSVKKITINVTKSQIFPGFNVPKIIKIGWFLKELFKE